MKAEKKVMMTGKQYRDIQEALQNSEFVDFNAGSDRSPEIIKVTEIYLDTDPEFTRNPEQYAKINDDKNIQVKIEYEE